MALFRKAAAAVNTHYDIATELTVALKPSIRRVRKLEAQGTPANGVVTGIHFKLNDDTTRKEFAITVLDGSGLRIGVRTSPSVAHRLRLGMPAVVKLDGDRGVLDWDAMTQAWGLGSDFIAQDSLRKPPSDGIIDTALDMRVQSHLKKWTPTQATIVSFQRCTVMGLPTQNWDVELQLADGSRALSKRDGVPSYAQWDAKLGAVVPAVIDPKDSSRASIDWPAFARAQFDTVGFDDDPPPGSIAAELEVSRGGSGAVSAMSVNAAPRVDDPSKPVVLDGTMLSWVDARRQGYMSQDDFEEALADWQEAGMCTPAQAALARATT